MGRNTSIKTAISDNFTQLKDNVNNQSLDVGATGKLTTTVDSDIVGAINEIDSDIGTRPHTTLTTTAKTLTGAVNEIDSDVGVLSNFDADIRDSNFVSTINTLNAKVNAGTSFSSAGLDSVGDDSDTLLGGFNSTTERASLVTAFNTLSQDIGKLDSNVNREDRLTTTANTLRGAVNELDSDIGDRPHTNLITTAKTLTGAINENKTSINSLAVFRNIATDSGSGSISVTVDSANDTLSILSGGSLKTVAIGGNKIQIDHDVTGASSVNNSGTSVIQDLTIDAHGHITGVASTTIDSAGLQTQINDLNAVVATDSAGLQTQINALDTAKTTLLAVFNMIYPVGSIYVNASTSSSPASLMGFGSWERYGQGRVLVSQNSSDVEFNVINETGGAKTHTLTTAQMPVHSHGIGAHRYPRVEYYGGAEVNITAFDAGTPSPEGPSSTYTSNNAGSGQAHNNLQPYITVYMWRRTA
jgi:hypothetical protein